jgi:MraZ protein
VSWSAGDEKGRIMEDGTLGMGPSGVFLGTFTPRLDEKGRLILPAKFRAKLAAGLVCTRGLDRCIFVFPIDEFRAVHDLLKAKPIEDKGSRDYVRGFLAYASDEIPDKQGRISISPALRQYAGIDRDVVVVGLGSRVEIWDVSSWSDYLSRTEDDYAKTAREVVDRL